MESIMSRDDKEPWVWWLDWRMGAVAAVVLVGLLVFAFGRLGTRSGGGDASRPSEVRPEDDPVEQARQLLVEEDDLNACRAALQQINTYLSQPNATRPPAATPDQRETLRKQLGLDAAAVEEVAAASYSLLDAHHMAYCFLMRDVARSLDVQGSGAVGGDSRAPLDKASAAFDWVVRQIRLPDRPLAQGPPDWVLRRGRGTDLDRALTFLGLLTQLNGPDGRPAGLTGALVLCPTKDDPKKLRLWVCAVLLPGGKDLYLFDPRLGLALPGPGGKGIATLAQARKDEVLRQLDAPGGPAYDVTAEQVKGAELQYFCPLSALAPRQRYLQDQLLPPVIEVRLAADLDGDMGRLQAAAASVADKPPAVGVWKPGVGRWRDFLGPDEGGVARPAPFALRNLIGFTLPNDPTVVPLAPEMHFKLDLVPWQGFPQEFRSNEEMPFNIGLGQNVRDRYLGPWLQGSLGSGGPRDRLLRGRFTQAAKLLVEEQEKRRDAERRYAEAGDLGPRVEDWKLKARRAYAEQLRKQRAGSAHEQEEANKAVEELWVGDQVEPVYLLLTGALAETRGPEVTFQLGLCKQEQAERVQARLDLLTRGKGKLSAADKEKARAAWRDALGWWNDYDAHYPKNPDRVSVRRLRGRAEEALGDTPAAIKDWQDVCSPMSEPEKVAVLYLARRLAAETKK
jgi:hypothetical protein